MLLFRCVALLKFACHSFVMSLFCHVALSSCRSFVMSLFRHVALSSCRSFVMSLFRYVALLNGSHLNSRHSIDVNWRLKEKFRCRNCVEFKNRRCWIAKRRIFTKTVSWLELRSISQSLRKCIVLYMFMKEPVYATWRVSRANTQRVTIHVHIMLRFDLTFLDFRL